MKANARTPAEIFGNNVRFVVPLFQRPYVWTQEDQWQPLWEDVQELARRVADAPPPVFGEPAPVPPHFLGAVVLESQATSTGYIEVRHVIDGQQRLTTLQLLLDAVQEVVAQRGSPADAAGLQSLVLNNIGLTTQPFEKFKVWPTGRDQAAFTAAMDGTDTPGGAVAATPIVMAHRFFASTALEWAEQEGAAEIAQRLGHLSAALARHLKLVVIDLEPGDNAQVIFESLNHRGSPLLAADLVKNLVFQVAQAQRLDVGALYREHWQELDEDFWREKQAQGRRSVPRIDLFLHHWMTMRLASEVPMDRIFANFREKIVKPSTDIAGLLAELAHDARVYATFDAQPLNSVPERFHYRVIRALDSAVVSPFLLWVMRHSPDQLPVDQRDRALRAVESWLVRRALVRATSKDLNNTLLALLKRVRERPVAEIGDATVTFLEEQSAPSRVWPDDVTVSSALADLPLYGTLTRPRLRMVLEALEDSLRSGFGEGQPCPRELTVEHVMPQAWRENWSPVLSQDEEVVAFRDTRLHTLGNLTLVSGKLNPALSNRRWAGSPESPGKRAYLLQHSQLKLNATLVVEHEHHWDDESIQRRTRDLTQQLLGVWPGPTRQESPAPASRISPSQASVSRTPTPQTPEVSPAAPGVRTRRLVDGSLTDLVAAGVLSRGTRLSGRYHGQTYSVAVRWDGSLESDGRAFASPTAAALALTGQESVNGWLFWRTAGDTPISELRDLLRRER